MAHNVMIMWLFLGLKVCLKHVTHNNEHTRCIKYEHKLLMQAYRLPTVMYIHYRGNYQYEQLFYVHIIEIINIYFHLRICVYALLYVF